MLRTVDRSDGFAYRCGIGKGSDGAEVGAESGLVELAGQGPEPGGTFGVAGFDEVVEVPVIEDQAGAGVQVRLFWNARAPREAATCASS